MVVETFTWCPMVDATGRITRRVKRVQFGDGYSQAVGDGINNKVQTWPLQFIGKRTQINEIAGFLDRHHGYRSFLWTPPIGEQGYYSATDYELTARGADVYMLAVTFQQVFYP